MKLEMKRRIGALIGYPLTFLLTVGSDEKERKEILDHRELFRARILGKRLK